MPDIIKLVGKELEVRGYKKESSTTFVKSLNGPWYGVVYVGGNEFGLTAKFGIVNLDINKNAKNAAVPVYGKNVMFEKGGPAILMVELHQLLNDSGETKSWEYSGQELGENAIKDLVEAIHQHGPMFFEKYQSLETVLDGFREHVGYHTFAQMYLIPVVLSELHLLDEFDELVRGYSLSFGDDAPDMESQYIRYIENLKKGF